ncbi:DUF3885 domain-containing protein [Bacillus sp. D386]|uniref:DUF3885 domain-containing protein n=1 Tax=Bacillus sp. D386 TaxID=2587155 RepID=UPI00111FE811|nr:DUF3885 domain-containing protein [Bacillus sp. D386]
MKVIDYLKEKFPSIELMPSIYNQWDIGIHFTLGGTNYQFKKNGELNCERFRLVYKQLDTIFNQLFEQYDDVFLVTNMYTYKTNVKHTRKLKVYEPFLKYRNSLNHIQVRTCPYPFELDEEEYETQQFSLLCKTKDIRITELLKAATHEDFPLKPRFGGDAIHYPDVFLVNITKDLILFVYDDRGCEVVAIDAERLRPLYEQHKDWVEDVDRQKIERALNRRSN